MALASKKSVKIVGKEKYLGEDGVKFGAPSQAAVYSGRSATDVKRELLTYRPGDEAGGRPGQKPRPKVEYEIVDAPEAAIKRVEKAKAGKPQLLTGSKKVDAVTH